MRHTLASLADRFGPVLVIGAAVFGTLYVMWKREDAARDRMPSTWSDARSARETRR